MGGWLERRLFTLFKQEFGTGVSYSCPLHVCLSSALPLRRENAPGAPSTFVLSAENIYSPQSTGVLNQGRCSNEIEVMHHRIVFYQFVSGRLLPNNCNSPYKPRSSQLSFVPIEFHASISTRQFRTVGWAPP